jgi:dsDNA-binding SOS-regulon protein
MAQRETALSESLREAMEDEYKTELSLLIAENKALKAQITALGKAGNPTYE